MSIVPYWSGIQYSGYQRLGALALGYVAKYGATAAYAKMVLGKRYRSRRATGMSYKRRKTSRNTYRKTFRIAKAAVNSQKETKWHFVEEEDLGVPVPVPESGGIITGYLNNPPAGTTFQQRVGREIVGQHLKVKFTLRVGPGASTEKVVRLIIFNYKSPNDAAVTTAEYFNAAANHLWPKEPLELYQSKTLWDRTYTLTTATTPRIDGEINIPLKGLRTTFDGSNTTLFRNGICMLAISDSATAGNQPLLNYFSSYSFKDM